VAAHDWPGGVVLNVNLQDGNEKKHQVQDGGEERDLEHLDAVDEEPDVVHADAEHLVLRHAIGKEAIDLKINITLRKDQLQAKAKSESTHYKGNFRGIGAEDLSVEPAPR